MNNKNKLEIKQQVNYYKQITNINMDSSKKYCSKCLCLLGDEKVVDGEGNWFCNWECKVDFHFERRQDMNDIMSELF